jgi:hypothetical protein
MNEKRAELFPELWPTYFWKGPDSLSSIETWGWGGSLRTQVLACDFLAQFVLFPHGFLNRGVHGLVYTRPSQGKNLAGISTTSPGVS